MSGRVVLLAGAAGVGLWFLATGVSAGEPPRVVDPRESARVELGRRLFFDPVIGRAGRVACAACHDPEHGFSDARVRSLDETGELPRHSQPLVDLGGNGFHWGGEFDTVRDVIDARVLPVKQAATAAAERALRRLRAWSAPPAPAPDKDAVRRLLADLLCGPYGGSDATPEPIAVRLSRIGLYDAGFSAAFGDAAVTPQRVGDALEAYLRSIRSSTSPFDRFLAGDERALGAQALRGFRLFVGKAGCAQCHVAAGPRSAFSDGRFHDTGVGARTERARRDVDLGRAASTFVESDRRAFKTPSLRDVARRAPYFHDGSAKTLADAVRYYDAGGAPDPHLDPRIHRLDLADSDVEDLVAFLGALTSDERPGSGRAAPAARRVLDVHVEDIHGAPVSGVSLTLRPFGDRLECGDGAPAATSGTTDEHGAATIAMPPTTHVVVEADGAPVSRVLPDWTRSVNVVAPPRGGVVLRLRWPDAEPRNPATLLVYGGHAADAQRPMRSFAKVRDLGPFEALYVTDGVAGVVASARGSVRVLDDERVPKDALTPGTSVEVDLDRATPTDGDRDESKKLSDDVIEIQRRAGVSLLQGVG